jgi:hypothetical protein
MHRSTSIRAAVCAAITVLSLSAHAFADPPKSAPVARSAPKGDYSYQFLDDPLNAGGFGANDARIVVASHAVRATLIRPRTAFIVEMLKTVENL